MHYGSYEILILKIIGIFYFRNSFDEPFVKPRIANYSCDFAE